MADAEVFNLFWVFQDPRNRPADLEVAQDEIDGEAENRVDAVPVADIAAAILYPYLLTPDVMIRSDDHQDKLELLVVTKVDELKNTQINRQLKICKGFDPMKPYIPGSLVAANQLANIKIKDLGELNDTKVYKSGENEDGRFWGRFDKRAVEFYKKYEFKHVWAVTLPPEALDIVDSDDPPVNFNERDNDGMIRPLLPNCTSHNPNWIVGKEFREKYTGDPIHAPYLRDLRYGFQVHGGDAHVGASNGNYLLQPYHPVFVYEELEYANVGHLADVHVCSRQQLIQKSTARVIEHPQAPAQSPAATMNICSQRANELFDAFRDNEADVVVIGGDLIDFVPQLYQKDFHTWKNHRSVKGIWEMLNVKDTHCNIDNIDHLVVYSLVLDFYDLADKPVYAVTGNHDAYRHSFGIAPTVGPGKKTNKDIAADHNLTWYESVLVFGEHYHEIRKWKSPLDPADWKWFYILYTPFADFAIRLPKQIVVGLGWGDEEDIMGTQPMGGSESQDLGHLPRADKSLSDPTWDLMGGIGTLNANQDQKNLILTTHFTFVSYSPTSIPSDVSLNPANWEGKVYWKYFGHHENGTFELKRKELYEDTLLDATKKVQVVLTGHSHRRGVYRLRPVRDAQQALTQLNTNIYDVKEHAGTQGVPPTKADEVGPYVILSDSGGPHPNHNKSQELNGVGRDNPGGTLIKFNQANGNIESIQAVESTMRPRFVVSLDYMDLADGLDLGLATRRNRIITKFETDEFDPAAANCTFNVVLHNDLLQGCGVTLAGVELFYAYYDAGNQQWDRHQFVLAPGVDNTRWVMIRDQNVEAKFTNNSQRATFALLRFARGGNCTLHPRYDFADPWTFEVALSIKTRTEGWFSKKRVVGMTIAADRYKSDYRFYPDFDVRKKYPEYAVVP